MEKRGIDSADCYRRFLDGDEEAAREIMSELYFGLVYFIGRYVHDIHTAEDVAMDVMAELFSRRRKYDSSSSLKTYVYMLGKSRAVDRLRHERALSFVPLDAAEDLASEREELEAKVLRTERERAVGEAIAKLPQDMAAAVHLVYFENMTYAEAARVMKKSRKQIDNLLFRAKKELRRLIGDEGKDLL